MPLLGRGLAPCQPELRLRPGEREKERERVGKD